MHFFNESAASTHEIDMSNFENASLSRRLVNLSLFVPVDHMIQNVCRTNAHHEKTLHVPASDMQTQFYFSRQKAAKRKCPVSHNMKTKADSVT